MKPHASRSIRKKDGIETHLMASYSYDDSMHIPNDTGYNEKTVRC